MTRRSALVSTITPISGGVPSMLRATLDALDEQRISATVAWYEPWSLSPHLSIPLWRLGQRRIDGQAGPHEMAVRVLDWLLIAVPALQPHQLHIRVAQQDADELGTHVAGRANDRDADAPLATVDRDAARGTGQASRAVRRDRSRYVDAHAHRRARPLTGGRLVARIGWTADMVRMTIHIAAYSCKTQTPDGPTGHRWTQPSRHTLEDD